MFTKLITTLCLLSSPLAAASAHLELKQVLAAVAERNPDALAAKAEARGASQMALAAHAWMPPRLDLGVMGLAWPNPDLGNNMGKTYGLTQELPFPGRTWLTGRAASFEAKRMGSEADMVLRKQINEAVAAYYSMAGAERQLEGLDTIKEATEEMAALSAKRAGFGQLDRMGQFMDAMLAMEDSNAKSMRPMADQQRLMAEAALRRLMGADPAQALPSPQVDIESLIKKPVPSEDEAMQAAEANSPALASALAEVEAAKAARWAAWGGWLPDLMVSGTVTEDGQGQRSSSAMLGLSLPWIWGWKQAGESGAAGAALEKAQAEAEAARLRAREQARTARGELLAVTESLRLTWTKTYPAASRGLKMARSGFRTNALGPTEILMAVQDYRMTQEKLADLMAQWGQAKAMLDELTAAAVAGAPKED